MTADFGRRQTEYVGRPRCNARDKGTMSAGGGTRGRAKAPKVALTGHRSAYFQSVKFLHVRGVRRPHRVFMAERFDLLEALANSGRLHCHCAQNAAREIAAQRLLIAAQDPLLLELPFLENERFTRTQQQPLACKPAAPRKPPGGGPGGRLSAQHEYERLQLIAVTSPFLAAVPQHRAQLSCAARGTAGAAKCFGAATAANQAIQSPDRFLSTHANTH
jgi:hypothetical protein